ncbi:hypothetical protein ATO6_13390 [Oceanicola sp. 22II-s10i]|uniref:DMT family transporter n=1 Tax=Oceanicola sp. 22II-s10i TaxID=1317116 RepID=UPI000B52082A|nr:DMT family transporter [Oceanicola sp. 22II-s10i]OWU84643.1 hypothetical protein ATO6_13390 [Oceanicola sp. 22II-s10i]
MSDNLRGAILMCVAMALFRVNETCTKLLAGEMPLTQIVTLRGLVITGGTFLIAWRMSALTLSSSPRLWGMLAIRTASEIGAAYFYLQALFNMPLANVTAISQSAPLMLSLAAAVFLREPLGWRRLSAIMIGLVGVLIIVRPGPDGFDSFAIYALISVTIGLVRDLVTRKMPTEMPSVMVTLCTVAGVTLAFTVGGLFDGQDWVAIDARDSALLVGAGVASLFAFISSITAMRTGELAFVTSFRYTGLIWALVIGFVIFGDWPTATTLLGAAIVVGSGLFTIYRERRLGLLKQTPSAKARPPY